MVGENEPLFSKSTETQRLSAAAVRRSAWLGLYYVLTDRLVASEEKKYTEDRLVAVGVKVHYSRTVATGVKVPCRQTCHPVAAG